MTTSPSNETIQEEVPAIPDDLSETARKLAVEIRNAVDGCDCNDCMVVAHEAALSALLAERQCDQWQPIETAPKDGTEILLYREDCGVILGRWIACSEFITDGDPSNDFCKAGDDEAWEEPDWFGADFTSGYRITNDGDPTHWMPLPEAPKGGEV